MLTLLHKTPVPGLPSALAPFGNTPDTQTPRLLVALADVLILYSMGKLQLLRKAIFERFPTVVRYLAVSGSRIFAGDMAGSVRLLLFDEVLKQFYMFAADLSQRWLTALLPLDYTTVMAADKFGNVFVLGLSQHLSDLVDSDASRTAASSVTPLQLLAHFHVGQLITSLHKTTTSTGRELITYVTNLGAIGVLEAFHSRTDVEVFQQIEQAVRKKIVPLSGNSHLKYRSIYNPVLNVVDGDLCRLLNSVQIPVATAIAADTDHALAYLQRKLFRYSC
jgi:splicing factor 3B subunit 3